MYRQFNIQQFYVLPTQCIYVFCVDLRTNSDYFSLYNINCLVFITETECLLRGTDWIFILISLIFMVPFPDWQSRGLGKFQKAKLFQ